MNPITYSELSFTDSVPVCNQFNDPYFSKENGVLESKYVFLDHNNLSERWAKTNDFYIAEFGFGTGLNFLLTAQAWSSQIRSHQILHFYSVEKYPIKLSQLQQIHQQWPQFESLYSQLYSYYPSALPGLHRIEFPSHNVVLYLMIGDVVESFSQLETKIDAWYLDGFAPAKNEGMWQSRCFELMATLSKEHTTFATFTSAGFVRRGLAEVGFEVKKDKGFGRKREMLYGYYSGLEVEVKSKEPWFSLNSIVQSAKAKKVAVIGAGIAGLTTARELVNQGLDVHLIEQQSDVASGASGNPCGLVMPRFSNDFSLDTQFYYTGLIQTTQFLNQLKSRFPELQWQQSGIIQLMDEAQLIKAKQTNYPASFAQLLSVEDVNAKCHINLKTGGLFFPHAGYLSPRQLCQTLLTDIKEKSVISFDTTVTSLKRQNNALQLFSDDRQIDSVDAIVIANSYAANQLVSMGSLQVEKNRGQLSILSEESELNKVQIPLVYDAYLTPPLNGQQMLGASYAPDEQLTPRIKDHERNLNKLSKILAESVEINRDILDARISFRAYSQDRMPIVGPVHDEPFYTENYADLHHGKRYKIYKEGNYADGLYVNIGHGSRGLVSSLPSARLISELITGNVLSMPRNIVNRIHPARFLIRQLKKQPIS